MATPTGPSIFVDIYGFTLTPASGTAVPIFGIDRISINRNEQLIKAKNNNTLRTVATHVVGIDDEISIETRDFNCYQTLMGSVGSGTSTLAFSGRAAAHNIYTGTLPDTTCTIINFVLEKKMYDQGSKAEGKFSLSGFCMESATGDSVDPISFAVAASPPATTYNLSHPDNKVNEPKLEAKKEEAKPVEQKVEPKK